jgi:hypothetical protein
MMVLAPEWLQGYYTLCGDQPSGDYPAIRTTSMDDIDGATDRDQLRRFSRIPNERMYDGLWGRHTHL